MKALCLLIVALCSPAAFLCAQAPAAPAGKLKAAEEMAAVQRTYREAREKLEVDFGKWSSTLHTWYQTNLEKLQTDTAKKGDLDGAVAIKAERERLVAFAETTPDQVANMPAALRALRGSYDASVKRITDEGARRDAEIRRKYLADLEALQKRTTVAGDIDEALGVKTEHQRFTYERTDLPTPLAAVASASHSTPEKPKTETGKTPPPLPAAEVADAWQPKYQRPEDHGPTRVTEMRDGWIYRRSGSKFGTMGLGIVQDGALRADFRWSKDGHSGNLQMATRGLENRRGYSLRREKNQVLLRWDGAILGTFGAPEPKPDETFSMELRVTGSEFVVKLDGREIIRATDERKEPVEMSIYFHAAGLRNIEVLNLDSSATAAAEKAPKR